jgi:glycosyltransferase involved in cell wall biosynthesis
LILLTTSDYFPQIGGLSTFTKNIESTLVRLKLDYKLFHWKDYRDIKNVSKNELSQYSLILNVHPQFSWLTNSHHEKMINFVHGSEILMTSPNIVKKIYKNVLKTNYFNKMSECYLNIFISEATLEKANSKGFKTDYSRDIIFQNCIDVDDAKFLKKELHGKLVFSCIVRNVPHKNLAGSLKLCEFAAELTGKKVELIVPKNSNLISQKVKIIELASNNNSDRDEAFKISHFNLLLSCDHSSKGFFEGFGLTVLEAARFGTPSIVMNTGGLPEAVHHGETGWVLKEISQESVKSIFGTDFLYNYDLMSLNCFTHTIRSHSLNEYSRFFEMITSERGVA